MVHDKFYGPGDRNCEYDYDDSGDDDDDDGVIWFNAMHESS